MQVVDNEAAHRFEARVGGDVAFAEYKRDGDLVVFTHTEVPAAMQGHGVGQALARGALDQVRARGLGVVPVCSFIAGFIDEHPEYQALVRRRR